MTTNNNPAGWPFPTGSKPTMNPVPDALKSLIEQERQLLLSDAKRNGVNIVHVFNEHYPMGGLTIAFRKTRPNETSTNMVDVAVATCSYADTFSRKIGTHIALRKWFEGDLIQLPLSSGYADEELNGIVKRKFHAMYFTL